MTQLLHKSHGGCNVAQVFGHFGTRCPSTNFSNNSSAPAHIIYCFIIRLHELQNCSGARQRQGAKNDITDNFANLVSRQGAHAFATAICWGLLALTPLGAT